jgi:hypothetical protein
MGHQDKPRNGKDVSQDLSGKAYGAAILAPRVKGIVPEVSYKRGRAHS